MGFLRRYESNIYGNYRKAGAIAGLWSGTVLVLYITVRWLSNVPVDAPQTYGSDVLLFVCMLAECYLYRRDLPGEKATLKELMMLNMWLAFVAVIIYGVFTWFYGTVMDGDFLSRCINKMLDGEQAKNATAEQKETMLVVIQNYTMGTLAWMGAFRTLVMGVLWSFLSALLFRNEQSNVVGTGLFGKRTKKK